jgi:anti-sigma factor RsiW
MSRMDDTMLMAYVDGEIDAATAREIEAQIASDPAVAARARQMRDSAALARAAFGDALHEPVPARLLAALGPAATPETNVVSIDRRAKPKQRFAVIGWAMAASLAALMVGYGVGTVHTGTQTASLTSNVQTASTDRWLDNVAGFYNVYATSMAAHDRQLVDFNAEDVPELEKWFGAKLNRRLAVPDLSSRGFTAQGGRLQIIGGKPAAQFLYNSPSGELVGLVIAFSDAPYLPAQTERRGEVNIVHWRNNGYAYALSGKIDQPRLIDIADGIWRDLERAS